MNEDISKPESSHHGAAGRKRGRSENEDSEECLPIAKRINNLQLGSTECSSDGGIQDSSNGLVQHNWDKDLVTSQPKNGYHSVNVHSHNNNTMPLGSADQPVPGCSTHAGQLIVGNELHTNNGVAPQLKGFIDDIKNDFEMEPYEPELDDSNNPHYYSINQLLYYANAARQTRTRNGFKQ